MTLAHLKKTPGEKFFIAFCYIFMGLFALSVVLPLLYILQITLSTSSDSAFRIVPKGFKFTLEHYEFVIKEGLILRPLFNSCYLTATSTLVAVVLTMFLAYPLSRKELIGRRYLNFFLILPMMISLGFLPKYLVVRQLGLANSYLAIILTSAVSAYNTIILRNFFRSIPESLIESARMDGCPEVRTLLQIVLPLSRAAIATITLFYMMTVWNKYFDIILYIQDSTKHTLQVILRTLVMDEEGMRTSMTHAAQFSENIQYTTIIVAIIPVLIIYPLLQKHFVKGIMLGSIKG